MNFIALMPLEIRDYVGETIDMATVLHRGVMNDHLEIFRSMNNGKYGLFMRRDFEIGDGPQKEVYPIKRCYQDVGLEADNNLPLDKAEEEGRKIAEERGLLLLLEDTSSGSNSRKIIWHPERWQPKIG